ncbi:MAG: hypothetical protein ABIG95_03955 [Candidatus Woesearchaeota archaeon]
MGVAEEARKIALHEIEEYGAPSLMNFELSEKKAVELAKKLKANMEIVKTGVYLMDLKLGQAMQEDRIKEHIQMSVEAAKQFLDKQNFSSEDKVKILNCVEAHHGTIPFSCMEAEICANADCYRFIHPIGFFGFIADLGKRGMEFEEIINYAEEKLEEKHKILSLVVCKEELEPYYRELKKLLKDSKK